MINNIYRTFHSFNLSYYYKEVVQYRLYGTLENYKKLNSDILSYVENPKIAPIAFGNNLIYLLPLDSHKQRNYAVGLFFEFPTLDIIGQPTMQLCFIGNKCAYMCLLSEINSVSNIGFNYDWIEIWSETRKYIYPGSISVNLYITKNIRKTIKDNYLNTKNNFPKSLKFLGELLKEENEVCKINELYGFYNNSIYKQLINWRPVYKSKYK